MNNHEVNRGQISYDVEVARQRYERLTERHSYIDRTEVERRAREAGYLEGDSGYWETAIEAAWSQIWQLEWYEAF